MANNVTQPLLHEHGHDGPPPPPRAESKLHRSRMIVKQFQSSRYSLYLTLALVGVDVFCIFSDIFIALYECDNDKMDPGWATARDVLGNVSNGITCAFVFELLLSLWAFGIGYFDSWFRCFDAIIIMAGFIVDVVLQGILSTNLEEIASLVIVLRLWRIVKIIEEISAGASLEMGDMSQRIRDLEAENHELKREMSKAVRDLHGHV